MYDRITHHECCILLHCAFAKWVRNFQEMEVAASIFFFGGGARKIYGAKREKMCTKHAKICHFNAEIVKCELILHIWNFFR